MKKFIKMVLALMPFNRKYYCSVCNHKVNYFRGFGSEAEIFQNIKITGGGIERNLNARFVIRLTE